MNIDKEIYFNYIQVMKKQDAMKFDIYNINTFDSFLSRFIIESLDYVLKFKRDFLKNLSNEEINQICGVVIQMLNEQ